MITYIQKRALLPQAIQIQIWFNVWKQLNVMQEKQHRDGKFNKCNEPNIKIPVPHDPGVFHKELLGIIHDGRCSDPQVLQNHTWSRGYW